MKKTFYAFLFLFCVIAFAKAAMASSEITTFPTEAKLTGDKVFVRSDPSTQGRRLANLSINSVVTVLARETGDMQYPWYKIRYSDGEGWVYGQYVKATDSTNQDVSASFAPVPAEVIEAKAFVRSDHDHHAGKVAVLEEGDALELLEEWHGNTLLPWYRVKTDSGEGWIYAQVVRRLDRISSSPAPSQAQNSGVLSNDGKYVTVLAIGQGTDRAKALEQAWIEAVRLAVGTIISSKSELNNDDFAESTIAHSRGVIESFDTVDEKNDGKRTTVTIRAKVQKEILVDAAKTYGEAQVVKTDASRIVKARMDDEAKKVTAEDKQKSGAALLKEVLESYTPEMFFSATLEPKIYYDQKTKKPYVRVVEKFNQDLFWKEFLPRLHKAFEGVAIKKKKCFYRDEVRRANKQLPKDGYLLEAGIAPNGWEKVPYSWDPPSGGYIGTVLAADADSQGKFPLKAIVPDDNASFTVYNIPCYVSQYHFPSSSLKKIGQFEDPQNLRTIWADFLEKMSVFVTFSIVYLDKNGEEFSVQIIRTGPRYFAVYRSYQEVSRSYESSYNEMEYLTHYLFPGMIFAPGYVNGNKSGIENLFLGTTNYNQKYDGGYEVELDVTELEKLGSMKFEVVFEK